MTQLPPGIALHPGIVAIKKDQIVVPFPALHPSYNLFIWYLHKRPFASPCMSIYSQVVILSPKVGGNSRTGNKFTRCCVNREGDVSAETAREENSLESQYNYVLVGRGV